MAEGSALGLIECRGFAAMVEASDAMVKAARVELKRYEKTIEAARQALSRGPEHLHIHRLLAMAHAQLGDAEPAVGVADRGFGGALQGLILADVLVDEAREQFTLAFQQRMAVFQETHLFAQVEQRALGGGCAQTPHAA